MGCSQELSGFQSGTMIPAKQVQLRNFLSAKSYWHYISGSDYEQQQLSYEVVHHVKSLNRVSEC